MSVRMATPSNNQFPASFATLTTAIPARIRAPRRQLCTLHGIVPDHPRSLRLRKAVLPVQVRKTTLVYGICVLRASRFSCPIRCWRRWF